jgi:DNA-binding beta-propeller fold protein YncE
VPRVRAPELSGAGGWIGTVGPLSLTRLFGKIVVLDFWTSCCINCVRVLDELRSLEERFADEIVVVGIHSPKFPHEHEHETVRRAVQRLHIRHPVLDDPDLITWQQYGVRGWPTLVVIDPEGYVVGGISGEGCGPVLTQTIQRLIKTHDATGTLVRGPIEFLTVSPTDDEDRVLDHPAKVAVEPGGLRVAIADTGHNRVLVCDLLGRVEAEFGLLHAPHGLRFDQSNPERVIVCDTGADRVVAVALSGGDLTVLATGIASPWDAVVDDDGSIVVAEAGRHRLRRIPAGGGETEVLAGTGQENLIDGPATDALLAQPSGLARLVGGLVFVDAEASALRVLTDQGEVRTLVGQGLFDWGASDGGPDSSALQHPLGLAVGPRPESGPDAGAIPTVYIADSFNSLLRAWTGSGLTSAEGALRTLPVAGLDEPAGLDVLPDGRLIVADTNHHRVVVIDPASGSVSPLELDRSWIGIVAGDPIAAREGSELRLPFAVDPGAMELDRSVGAPVHIVVTATPPSLLGPGPRSWALEEGSGALAVNAGRPGRGTLLVDVSVSVCDDQQCTVLRAKTRHDLSVTAAP